MKKNGVEEFVERCKNVIEYHDQEKDEEEHSLDRMKARHEESLKKFNNTSLNSEYARAKKEFHIIAKPLPFIVQYPNEPLKARLNSSQTNNIEVKAEKQKNEKSLEFSEIANST